MAFVVVVMAVVVFDGIVLFAVSSTPTITKGIAETWYHEVAEEPLGSAAFEYGVEKASDTAFFSQSVSVGKVELFAFNVDEFACFVND